MQQLPPSGHKREHESKKRARVSSNQHTRTIYVNGPHPPFIDSKLSVSESLQMFLFISGSTDLQSEVNAFKIRQRLYVLNNLKLT